MVPSSIIAIIVGMNSKSLSRPGKILSPTEIAAAEPKIDATKLAIRLAELKASTRYAELAAWAAASKLPSNKISLVVSSKVTSHRFFTL